MEGAWHDSESESDGSDGDATSDGESQPRKKKKQKKGVSLVDGPNRLKKLRRYRDETAPLSVQEYERRLRERHASTAGVAARTDWATAALAAARREGGGAGGKPRGEMEGGRAYSSSGDDSDDDGDGAAADVLDSNASLFAASSAGRVLPPTLLDVVRVRDGNLADPNRSAVSALQFHPRSDPDAPLFMTAGMDKMLRFFKPTGGPRRGPGGDGGGEAAGGGGGDFAKVHGIHFPQMPIATAAFLGDSGSVVLSGRRPFFYVYDAASGKIERVPGIVGRKERSLEKFVAAPDGRTLAFLGNDGYVILVDGRTRRWMGDLKMNGSVRAVAFSEDGEYVLGSGSDGDVYT